VISLIYTSCYHICPMITKQLERVVEIAADALGEGSFSVATIGFDTQADTPQRMRSYARERGIDASNWWFLSTDAATIEALSSELGFIFFSSPKGFDHLAQTTILDAQGRVYRQVYGELLNSPNFVEPLKELVWGLEADPATLSGWLKGVRLFCTIYDPSTGRYRFDYSIFIALAVGIISLGSVAVFIVRAWRQSRPS
ncbi:MAG: SCO family protein, partial [Pseudomonadota bacterium]